MADRPHRLSWFLGSALGIAFPATGCDFFEELKSAPSATEGEDTDADAGTGSGSGSGSGTDAATATATAACTLLDDDHCADQDTLHACNLETGEVEIYDCGRLCGGYMNFTCINSGTGQHACWCVESGKQKVYSCPELEECLQDCGAAVGGTCSDQCFRRTTASTIRMYGAVVHCAHAACEPLCATDPVGCNTCLAAALAGQAAGCALERSVCDADKNDEPGP